MRAEAHCSLVLDGVDSTAWVVARVEVTEGLDIPTHIVVTAKTADPPELDALDGCGALVELRFGEDNRRSFSGVVVEAYARAFRADAFSVTVTFVSKIGLLALGRDHRIFQEMSVPDVVNDVFDRAGLGDLFEWSTNTTYEPQIEFLADQSSDLFRVNLELRPPHYLLHYRRGFRIFQELSVPDIVRQVFDSAGISSDALRWELQTEYVERAYCVQYDESEWDFVCRLLEDEGIYFAFEHAADGVVMVVADASDSAPAIEGDTLRFDYREGGSGLGDENVTDWVSGRRLSESKVSLDDYDGLHPSLDLAADSENDEPHTREHYEYPGGYAVAGEGTRRASVRLEELSTKRRGAEGQSDYLAIQPGLRFELLDHPLSAGEFLVSEIEFELDVAEEHGAAGARDSTAQRLRFRCMPLDQLFRPNRRTPRPRIDGVQTAKVTGPAGEEIHCDEHGRVKVQFHWDLDGQLDERTTCWIRSTHPHTTGSVTVPRIGWEVLVQFYEGDPDRPVVLGHVFNPLHVPAFDLPAQKTVTAHRTVSSPGAGAVNEVYLDDAAGAQEIAINAGKDLTINAVENKTMQTTSNYGRQVIANRTFSVGANQKISLEANHDDGVGVDQTIDVGANRNVRVSANAAATVNGSTTMDIGGLENMMIGNPISAVLDIIKSEAIAAAEGAAASAASRVQGALLAPVQPALDAVSGALGEASSYLGPAQAIIGGDNPAVAMYGDALGAISEATTPPDVAGMAGGMAAAVASGALDAAGGGGGGGSGVWGSSVVGNMTETIGALGAINSAYGITFNTTGSVTETIGAARAALVKGGWSESCASKSETVGVYFVNTSGGVGIEAGGAVTLNTAASVWKLGKSYTASAGALLAVTAATIKLDASESVTLKCGPAEVVIDSGGIACKGAVSVTIKAGTLNLKQPAIGPG